MIELAGGTDVLGRPGERSRRVGWADIAAHRPDLVVFMPCGYDLDAAIEQGEALWDVPEFADTPAARARRVFAVDASSFFSRPGPRIVDGLELLAWIMHPDQFDPPPAGRAARLSQ
jgi:iron complex transport system substrate-binding protein